MTYCLGILTVAGLVLASDSRSNAGVDQITQVRKLALFSQPGARVIGLLAAGNLATCQAVTTRLREVSKAGRRGPNLHRARTLFEAAEMVGEALRAVIAHDGAFVRAPENASATFLLGGQIEGEAPRLFEIYSAGNFVEASPRSPFLQIGETKYGKPILDRALAYDSPLDFAAKLALLSFDATLRSNLSVGLPIDVLRYEKDSFSDQGLASLEADNPYWTALTSAYSEGLTALVAALPSPPARFEP